MDVLSVIWCRESISELRVNYGPQQAFCRRDDRITAASFQPACVTMHASDRIYSKATIEDLRAEEGGSLAYAKRLSSGEVGKGLNDYDAILAGTQEQGV